MSSIWRGRDGTEPGLTQPARGELGVSGCRRTDRINDGLGSTSAGSSHPVGRPLTALCQPVADHAPNGREFPTPAVRNTRRDRLESGGEAVLRRNASSRRVPVPTVGQTAIEPPGSTFSGTIRPDQIFAECDTSSHA